MLYRAPTTSPEDSALFYQSEYESDFTTDVPNNESLSVYLSNNFSDTPKDFSRYIDILRALGYGKNDRLLDFGCSWGYGSWQFQNNGFNVIGFDVSTERVQFARQRLAVEATDSIGSLEAPIDVFFSAHVLEHVPSVSAALRLGFDLLREGGVLVSITPNGSLNYRQRNPGGWKRSWGLKHPNLLDEKFYSDAFAGRPYLLTSDLSNGQLLRSWSQNKVPRIERLDGWELLAVCEKRLH